MSDKPFNKLNELDQIIRRALPVGMNDGVHLTIEFFSAFELFNSTRQYHNYETWADGYRVTGKGVRIEREDLDDAIKAWAEAVK